MIEPVLQDDAFLADVERTRGDRSGKLRFWWLGQSGVLLQWAGRHLLMDPYLSNSLTKKYAKDLPPNLTIRITNPKAMIILGRDRRQDGSSALDQAQLLDLEVIKRKYANMMDIMTYDDLLRRLENIIASLWKRVEAQAAPEVGAA